LFRGTGDHEASFTKIHFAFGKPAQGLTQYILGLGVKPDLYMQRKIQLLAQVCYRTDGQDISHLHQGDAVYLLLNLGQIV